MDDKTGAPPYPGFMRHVTAACAVLMFAAPALAQPREAQPRSPMQRQILTDLAYVIGEAHALSQTCRDPADQHWRERMIALIETEQPEAALQQRLQGAFNAGYSERRAQFPACTGAALRADAQVADQGQALARRLADSPN